MDRKADVVSLAGFGVSCVLPDVLDRLTRERWQYIEQVNTRQAAKVHLVRGVINSVMSFGSSFIPPPCSITFCGCTL